MKRCILPYHSASYLPLLQKPRIHKKTRKLKAIPSLPDETRPCRDKNVTMTHLTAMAAASINCFVLFCFQDNFFSGILFTGQGAPDVEIASLEALSRLMS